MATLKIADRRSEAAKFVENWRKQNGLPANSRALPPVDSVPVWMRGYIFHQAKSNKSSKLKIT